MIKCCSNCDHFNPIRAACQRCEKAVKVTRPDIGTCFYWKQIKPEVQDVRSIPSKSSNR